MKTIQPHFQFLFTGFQGPVSLTLFLLVVIVFWIVTLGSLFIITMSIPAVASIWFLLCIITLVYFVATSPSDQPTDSSSPSSSSSSSITRLPTQYSYRKENGPDYRSLFHDIRTAYRNGRPDVPDNQHRDSIWHRGICDLFRSRLEGDSILTIGTGTGRDQNLLDREGLTVIGLDLSEALLQSARNRNSNLSLLQCNHLWLAFPDRSFAGLYAQFSLLHLPHYALLPAFTEWNRVLEPGGISFLSFVEHENRAELIASNWLSSIDNRCPLYFQKPFHVKHMINKAGFSLLMHKQEQPRTFPTSRTGDTVTHQFLMEKEHE